MSNDRFFMAIGLLGAFLFSFPPMAQAYIPRHGMILSRTAEQHGKGPYLIEQNLTLTVGNEPPVTIRESWTILNEQTMRLQAVGTGAQAKEIRINYVYENGQRASVDADGVRRIYRPSLDWFEPYFHFRFSKRIRPLLIANQILPSAANQEAPPVKTLKDLEKPLPPQDFLRLSRLGGAITWAFGEPTPVGASSPRPGLWIEQDRFVIRQIRLASLAEIRANDYQVYKNDLWLPRERLLKWNDGTARITLVRVTPLTSSSKVMDQLRMNSLDFGKDPSLSLLVPAGGAVDAFYRRFR